MSTHDYVIDNQSAAAFRADLNAVLAAVATQNSSAVAPTTTFADMLWYDTATNILKKRNEANSAWISLGTIDEGAGTFTPSGGPPVQIQSVWNTGTGTVESTITPAKLDDKIENKLNVTGSAPMYACRAWVNFNGTGTVAIRASGNVSSITDNGTGNYTVNFTTAMPDANYVAAVNGGNAGSSISRTPFVSGKTTTSCLVTTTVISSGGATDVDICDVAIFR